MKLTPIKVMNSDREWVEVLGAVVSKHFAWSQAAHVATTQEWDTRPEALIHRPTGASLLRSVPSRKRAIEIAQALESMGIGHLDSENPHTVGGAIAAHCPKGEGVRDWLQSLGRNEDKEKTKLEELLATPQWRGSTTSYVEHELMAQSGNCGTPLCAERHGAAFVKDRRGGKTYERRHYELVACVRLDHPSGAYAFIRRT
jgi:hypothetical protein